MRFIENKNTKIIKELIRMIMDLKIRCKVNFAGFWEIDHNSYNGDWLDLPCTTVREWTTILKAVNSKIADKKRQS